MQTLTRQEPTKFRTIINRHNRKCGLCSSEEDLLYSETTSTTRHGKKKISEKFGVLQECDSCKNTEFFPYSDIEA